MVYFQGWTERASIRRRNAVLEGAGQEYFGVPPGSVYLDNPRHGTTNECQEPRTCGSSGGRRQSGPPGRNCCRAFVFLVSAGLALASRSPPPVLGVRATHPLSSTLLGAISPPRHRAVLARLPRSTKPAPVRQGAGGGGAAGAGSVTPPPPSQPGCWGQWQERRAPPATRGVGWGRQKTGTPARIRANRTLQKAAGPRFRPAPRELQSGRRCPGCVAPLRGLAAPARPPGGHDPSAPRSAPPGSPAARCSRRALGR